MSDTSEKASAYNLVTMAFAGLMTLASYWFYNAFFHPLASVPGPRHWAATSFFYSRAVTSGQYAQKALRLHAKHGSLVRIGPNELSTTDSEAWKVVYANKAGTSFPKSSHWSQVHPNGSHGILASSDSDHGRIRKVFSEAFAEKSLSNREELINKHARDLVTKLAQLSKGKSAVNVTDELEYVCFDIAGDFVLGRSFECVSSPANRSEVRTIRQDMKTTAVRATRSIMGVDWLTNLIEESLGNAKSTGTPAQSILTSWSRERLAGQTASQTGKHDLVDFVTSSTHKDKSLRQSEAENAIRDFVIAGSETISTTVVAALLNLTNHPDSLQQLRDELTKLKKSNPWDHTQLARSKSLNAVIDETMRLAPSMPHALPRTVPPPGASIGRVFLPEGTGISFNQYAAYRDPANFSMPTEFKPERWLDPTKFPAHNAEVFKPFSVGPRDCIGKQWGLRVTRALLVHLVLAFDFNRVGADWAWEDQNTFLVWEKKDLKLLLNLRS